PTSSATAAHLSSARRWASSAGGSPLTRDSSTPETTTDGSMPPALSVASRAGEAEASTSEITGRVWQRPSCVPGGVVARSSALRTLERRHGVSPTVAEDQRPVRVDVHPGRARELRAERAIGASWSDASGGLGEEEVVVDVYAVRPEGR